MNISQKTGIRKGSRGRIRELVRIRDNHTCQCCGKKWLKGQRRFDVHHLDESKEGLHHELSVQYDRDNMDKLITYCHKCHLNLDSVIRKMQGATGGRLELVDRNNKIVEEYTKKKTSMKKLGIKYSITHQRIQQIIAKHKRLKSG